MTNTAKALNLFKMNQTGSFKHGRDEVLVVTPNAIVIRFYESENMTRQEVLAARLGGEMVGNSSAMGALLNHRGISRWSSRAVVVISEQLELAELIPMIPFGVLKEAKLNLKTYRELDKTEPETLLRKFSDAIITENQIEGLKRDAAVVNLEVQEREGTYIDGSKRFDATYFRKQHFAGARLFQCSGQTLINPVAGENPIPAPEVKTFLLDVDRGELKHGIINPFLVEFPSLADGSTIQDAYEALKPAEVKGVSKFERQGEWFFIPADEFTAKRAQDIADKRTAEIVAQGENGFGIARANNGVLRAGRNRPNRVEVFIELDGKFYVKGNVSHDGREHADLKLESFHMAIPNTATTSWTITGDID